VARPPSRSGGDHPLAELISQGTDEAVEQLREALIRSGAREAVEQRIRTLGDAAAGYARELPLADEEVRAELIGLVETVTGEPAAVSGRPSAPAAAPRRAQEPPRTAT
jgi:geranylgeranyl diphosphate synthase, type I